MVLDMICSDRLVLLISAQKHSNLVAAKYSFASRVYSSFCFGSSVVSGKINEEQKQRL